MNAGGVDKACKSNGNYIARECDYIKFKGAVILVADEVVIGRYQPFSQE